MIAALIAAAALSATFTTPQDRAACKAQPELAWCVPAAASGRAATMADLEAVELEARAKFRFKEDAEDADVWQSATNSIGKPWRGDCDDMTFTVLDMLAKRGIDPKTMKRAIVIAQGGNDQGAHMVGVVETSEGDIIVADTAERIKSPIRWAEGHYRYMAVSPLDQGLRWFRK